MPMLSEDELERFRTKFCTLTRTSGCEFGPERCNYSHNDYWPRRCPFYLKDRSALRYVPICCPEVKLGSGDTVMESKCPRGGHCPFAHSAEEIWYHPLIYKVEVCEEYRLGDCDRYYCPKVHGLAEQRCPKCYNLPYCRGVNIPHIPGVTIVDKLRSPSVRRGSSKASSYANYSKFLGNNSECFSNSNDVMFGCSCSNSILKKQKSIEIKGSTVRQVSGFNSITETLKTSFESRDNSIVGDCEDLDKIGVITKNWLASYNYAEGDASKSTELYEGDIVRIWNSNKNGLLYCRCVQGSNFGAEGWIPASIVHEFYDKDEKMLNKKLVNFSESDIPNSEGLKQDLSNMGKKQGFTSNEKKTDIAAMFSLLTTNDSVFQVNNYQSSSSPLPLFVESEDSLQTINESRTNNDMLSFTKQQSIETSQNFLMDRPARSDSINFIPTISSNVISEQNNATNSFEKENKIPQVVQIENLVDQLRAITSETLTLQYWNKVVNSAFNLLGVALLGQRFVLKSCRITQDFQKGNDLYSVVENVIREISEETVGSPPIAVDESKLPEVKTVSTDPSIALDKVDNDSLLKCRSRCNSIFSCNSEQKKVLDEKVLSCSSVTTSNDGWLDWKIALPDFLSTLDNANAQDILSQIETSNQQKHHIPDQYSSNDIFSSLISSNGPYESKFSYSSHNNILGNIVI